MQNYFLPENSIIAAPTVSSTGYVDSTINSNPSGYVPNTTHPMSTLVDKTPATCPGSLKKYAASAMTPTIKGKADTRQRRDILVGLDPAI